MRALFPQEAWRSASGHGPTREPLYTALVSAESGETVRRQEARGLGLILMSTVAYGTMPILAKAAYLSGVRTGALLAWRFTLASLLFALLSRRSAPPLRQRLVLWGLGAVFIGNALAYFTALETVPATTVALVLYTYPVIVTLLSAVMGVEDLTPRRLTAAVLAFGGCALTVGGALARGPGVVFALVSAFVYATYIVLCSRFAARVPAETAALHLTQIAAVAFAVWAVFHGGLSLPATASAWGSVLAIAVFCTVVAVYAFLAGLARVGPARAAVLSSLEVLVTMGLAFAFLGERLAARQWVGAALILGAVALQYVRRP